MVIALWIWISGVTGGGGIAEEPGSMPFRGVPHAVPGHIEAEEFDLGGDGVAFHGAGPVFTNYGWGIPRGRPDAEIAVDQSMQGFGGNHVWMRGGEWMAYTIQVVESGPYTVLLKTGGAPTYVQETGNCAYPFYRGQGWVSFHLELDGFRATPDLPAVPQVVSPRLWLEAGRHQLRVVVDAVSDVSGLDYAFGSNIDLLRYFTFVVDWMEIVRSPDLIPPTPVAGGGNGFQDGVGAEVRFGYGTHLLGQTPGGDLALFDEPNAVFRIASPDGVVWTLAGYPGNPPGDGFGSQAGFGHVVHSVISPSGDLFSLEGQPGGGYRIARTDPSGFVTTIYTGTPVAHLGDFVPGWFSGRTNLPVALSRLTVNNQGDLEALGEFLEDRLYVCGPWSLVSYASVLWQARFRIIDLEAREVAFQATSLPTLGDHDLGEGYRVERFRVIREEPAGFPHEVLPGTEVFSILRTADGTLWAMIGGVLSRLSPDPDTGLLSVFTVGSGSTAGAPGRWIRAGEEILLNATPTSRFSQFAGWSDGSSDNPRLLRFEHDTTLSAQFAIRFPEPHGIVPQSPSIGVDGYFQFKVYGASQPYQYELQQSENLRDWFPVPRRSVQLKGAGSVQDGSLTAAEAEVWVRTNPGGMAKYFRTVMQDQ